MTGLTQMRTQALRLFQAAVAAADPTLAMQRALQTHPLPVPDKGGRLILIAVGKAAPAMMKAALAATSGLHSALVVTHHENTSDVIGATTMRAGHPVPDQAGLDAGRAVVTALNNAGPADRVVALISGGGSALLPAPVDGLTLADKQAVSALLLAGGLDITEMNLVRQQLSQLKGGGFLRLAAPAPVTGYLLSDVIGDDLRVIASGPTVGPVGTAQAASDLLRARGIWADLPPAVQETLHNASPATPLPHANNLLIGSNRQSLQAMATAAPDWSPEIVTDQLTGDVGAAALKVLNTLTSLPPPNGPKLWLFGGETTVKLQGNGLGGRNQELALRVAMQAPHVPFDWVFLSGGTDGRDGPTDAAGGIVDAGTSARIAAAGGTPTALLANNDSYAALSLAGDLLQTEATGTNVADVQALLALPQSTLPQSTPAA